MKKIFMYLLSLPLLFAACTKDGAYNGKLSTAGQGGSLARFAIVGNYLYSVDEKQLKVVDISQPENPVLKNTQDVGFSIETIFPLGDKLFIGSATEVFIYSISDPANPKKLSSAISPEVLRRCDPVVAKDSVAYATLRTSGPCGWLQSVLAVYNIQDIEHPVQVATVPVNEPFGLGYSGNVLYVCDNPGRLLLFDISDAYDPQLINTLQQDDDFIDVIPYGNVLICWVRQGMILYDINDTRHPILIAKIN